jgi:putative glutamine amidotransferase
MNNPGDMRKGVFDIVIVIVIGFSITFLISCCSHDDDNPVLLKIALSKATPVESYANYYNWIKSLDSTAVCMDMYDMPLDSAIEKLRSCSGLILTGGTDINPAWYEDPGDTLKCTTIDDHRDTLEIMLLDSAIAWGIPVLGICRGHQMLNVALGGSLIKDIPTEYDTTVTHRCQDFSTCFHPVTVVEGSLLNDISGVTAGTVNSAHHQGIKVLSPRLKIVAYAPDSLPEAVQLADPSGMPFILGVQWHPERLGNENPLSGKIGERFLQECRRFER